jgi:hypothetical protein
VLTATDPTVVLRLLAEAFDDFGQFSARQENSFRHPEVAAIARRRRA